MSALVREPTPLLKSFERFSNDEEVDAGRIHPIRWDVESYFELAQSGIIGQKPRVELIRGEIIMIPPIGEWQF